MTFACAVSAADCAEIVADLAFAQAVLVGYPKLDKLASNVAVGRAGPCGVHWRSDCEQGMYLGEACAIAALQDMRRTYNESFVGFKFNKFDGTPITI